jgi:hypothetical protein
MHRLINSTSISSTPTVHLLSQIIREAGNLLIRHTGSIPVEAGTEIVGQHLVGVVLMDPVSKLFSFGDSRNLGFHPNEVGVRGIGTSALNAIVNAGSQLVVPFANTTFLPVKVNLTMSKQTRKDL